MRNWKRRTRGIRKMTKAVWFYLYIEPGLDLRSVYKIKLKSDKREFREWDKYSDAIEKKAEGKHYYEDCNYHICRIISLDARLDSVRGFSLIDGSSPRNCSLRSCGVKLFTEKEALARAAYYKEQGRDRYLKNYNDPSFSA